MGIGCITEFRIKPEESQFKVGDFVRYIHSNNNLAIQIDKIDCGFYYYFKNAVMGLRSNELIKWEPKANELVWVRNSKWHNQEESILKAYDYDACRHYDLCEPFLNSKPSWFKD